jgi:hypothetical protein
VFEPGGPCGCWANGAGWIFVCDCRGDSVRVPGPGRCTGADAGPGGIGLAESPVDIGRGIVGGCIDLRCCWSAFI